MIIPVEGTSIDGEAEFLMGCESASRVPFTPRGGRWTRYFLPNLGEYTKGGDGIDRLMSISTVIKQQTSGYSASASDFAIGITASGGGSTISLPAASSNKGKQYAILKIDASANAVAITPNGTDKIEAAAVKALTLQYQVVWIISDGISNWIILGERNAPSAANSSFMFFSDPGSIPAGTRYMRPGSATVTANEIFFRFTRPVTVKNLSVNARIAPGAGKIDVFTVRKEAADTTLTVSLTNANLYVLDSTHSVSFAAGERFSLKLLGGVNTATNDVIVTVEVY